MGLAQRLFADHRHGDGSGWVLNYPRTYEWATNAWSLGLRARMWDRLVGLSGAEPGNRVLDVGCGTGYFTRRIARAVHPGGSVVGIDPSQSMVDYAARRAPANAAFQVASAEDLPFSDQSFDVVVSSLAFHHFPVDRRADAVRQMFRVLRPGGRLCIADLRPSGGGTLHRIAAVFNAHAREQNRLHQLDELITDAGFSIVGTGDRLLLHYITAQRPLGR
ncbi:MULTISPECIES: class I SAM-dependent methyltransferase [Mycobacterium]|uniref:Class I SAM-dependent methyltransferase n=9 Tax=Mycobacterium avium complex (MAC) TaxID=120793 RepID=A0A1Y0T9Z3_MYCIT|nr:MULTISPECIES: class I SAM-dependent methyltransferase [Mycobacterium]APT10454.1 methyltransferase [Mycobacterium avium subsp. hominissuis]ARV82669.1 methyltransferase [Mycobacterium intracellulare subsp. chimaera]ASL15632.1 type 11 methyltransferase [Mycobacterium intracellulare subsp. chimaera]ASL21752.1 type 11 methyltransferase [Mycobacterium intracellulare subsp. chimaera]ASQ86806.1 methyltransferase [Mycobacterium intracellulare subsp. chimaera]